MWVCDTTCQIRLHTSDFIFIAHAPNGMSQKRNRGSGIFNAPTARDGTAASAAGLGRSGPVGVRIRNGSLGPMRQCPPMLHGQPLGRWRPAGPW